MKKRLLVLDLNGVLLFRRPKWEKLDVRPPDFEWKMHQCWIRPGAAEFVSFCLERFAVGVWSSAKEETAKEVVNRVMTREEERKELLFIWGQERCRNEGPDPESTEKRVPLFAKHLADLWKKFPKYDESNTLMLDDSAKKLKKNPELSYFIVKSWSVLEDNADLARDGRVWELLDQLSRSDLSVHEFHKHWKASQAG